VAAELTDRARAELPVLAQMEEREQLLAAAWLAGLRSPRTRRAYAADLAGWLAWLRLRGIDALAAARVHVDLWASVQLERVRRPQPCGGDCRRCRRSTSTAPRRT